MTVRIEQDRIILDGRCRIEDAESLLSALQRAPRSTVSIDTAESLHTAVVQVLLAANPVIVGCGKHELLSRYGVLGSKADSQRV